MVGIDKEHLRQVRRDVSFVFQDPGSSLNPRLPIGESIGFVATVRPIRPSPSRIF